MKDLRHPAKPLFHNESDVDITVHSNEESEEEEDYHSNESPDLVGRYSEEPGPTHVLGTNSALEAIRTCSDGHLSQVIHPASAPLPSSIALSNLSLLAITKVSREFLEFFAQWKFNVMFLNTVDAILSPFSNLVYTKFTF